MTTVLRANDLFDIEVKSARTRQDSDATMPPIFNLKFRYNGRDADLLAGGGVYATFYRQELLYVGIFTGEQRIPFASNVASARFYKHLEALTLRGRAIGFTERNYERSIALDRPRCPLVAALRQTRIPRGNGTVKTYPSKVEFASDNWAEFSRIEHDPLVLQDFTFAYGRTAARHFNPAVTYQQVKNYLSAIESRAIERHNPRCNERRARANLAYLQGGPALEEWNEFLEVVGDPYRDL